jgi:hypothetical protein
LFLMNYILTLFFKVYFCYFQDGVTSLFNGQALSLKNESFKSLLFAKLVRFFFYYRFSSHQNSKVALKVI